MKSRPAEKEKDLEFLIGLRNETVCVEYSNRGILTLEQVEKDYFHTPDKNAYVVEDNDKKIGYLICRRLNDGNEEKEGNNKVRYQISVALIPEARGKGYGGPMMYEAARLCIDQHGAEEVVADVHARNLPSIRSMEKVGFIITKREGQIWEMMYSDHEYWDK